MSWSSCARCSLTDMWRRTSQFHRAPKWNRLCATYWSAPHTATACQVARPPARIGLERPALGDFYSQAFDRSVALPVAEYDYNSGWISFCWRDLHPLEWQLASLHGQKETKNHVRCHGSFRRKRPWASRAHSAAPWPVPAADHLAPEAGTAANHTGCPDSWSSATSMGGMCRGISHLVDFAIAPGLDLASTRHPAAAIVHRSGCGSGTNSLRL
jgi:hypothetical protein